MNPTDLAGFWRAFQSSQSWKGLRLMAQFSDTVSLRLNTLRHDMQDAIDGYPNLEDIRESIQRLLEVTGSQVTPEAATEMAPILALFGINQVYDVLGNTAQPPSP